MKKSRVLFAAIALAAALWGAQYFFYSSFAPAFMQTGGERGHTRESAPYVMVHGEKMFVEIAKDAAAVQKGLSGRASLSKDRGMLFIFEQPARYRFWMPDMHFPIDIIWIEGGRVVDLDKSVSPEFDPLAPRFYSPERPVRYVLETNSGFAESAGIVAGDTISFYNIE